MRKKLAILTIVSVLLATALLTHPTHAAGETIVVDVSHGQGTKLLDHFVGNLTDLGYTVVLANGGINSTVLEGASFLFVGHIYGKANNLTDAEIDAIKAWFNKGEKAIWVDADSDYGGAEYIAFQTNKILEAIGSKLRAEITSVEDPQSNAKAAYRVVANVTNTADPVKDITSGVSKALFHGPTFLYGVKDGTPVALEDTSITNVYWVMKTSPAGVVKDNTPTTPPLVHTDGQKGSFVIMAVEKHAGPNENNKIVVSGETPYGGYMPVFAWTYYDVSLDGPTLVKNTVTWGLKVEAPFPWLTVGVVVVVVAIAVVGLVAYSRRRPA
ncbi:MAG: hypothetical protein ACE5Z5_13905 [Candidatus Bathyarchaeia archaeon]